MKLFPDSVRAKLKEMRLTSGLRDSVSAMSGTFFGSPKVGVLRDTTVDYESARQLYYNTRSNICNGAFFAKPIVDGISDHIGLPICSIGDAVSDALIDSWINDMWAKEIWEMYRNSMRDTKSWVRLRKVFPSPLISTEDEKNGVEIEILDADRVTPYYNPVTRQLSRVEILYPVYVEEEVFDPAIFASTAYRARGKIHNIIEIITPTLYQYYDETEHRLREDLTTDNDWGFIPILEVFNDFDSALNGGTSELENPFPFFQAFHDLMVQTRQAHGYHADPKVKFKLKDVINFLRNNFKESFNGEEFTGKINWQGKDVYFMEDEEDVGFVEAQMHTTDSVTFMEFVLDCICISAEVTRAILFEGKVANPTNTDELFRFKAKIWRKRNNFASYLQQLVSMALLVTTGQIIKRPSVSWRAIDIADLAAEGQAMNQVVTAAEVGNRAGVISKKTYADKLRQFFPTMADHNAEQNQIATEVAAEQKLQLDFEKELAAIRASSGAAQPGGANGGGPNSGRRGRLPIQVTPTPPGG